MKSPENYWDLLIDSGSNDNVLFINKNLQHHKATNNKYEKSLGIPVHVHSWPLK